MPDIIKEAGRNLRKNMTDTEKIIWNELRDRKLEGVKFLRQYPIYVYTENKGLDRYIIPDFICKEGKVVIEIDGGVHSLKEVYLLDLEKENILTSLGYKILRFTNEDVFNNLDFVMSKIKASLS